MKLNIEASDVSWNNCGNSGPTTERARSPVRIIPKGWGREVWLVNQ